MTQVLRWSWRKRRKIETISKEEKKDAGSARADEQNRADDGVKRQWTQQEEKMKASQLDT